MSRIKGKRTIAAVLAVVMMLSMTLSGWPAGIFMKVCAAEFDGGTGIPANPFLISNRDQLASIGGSGSNGKYYALTQDIDLSGGEWTPINNFYGILDGRGYSVKNLYVRGKQYAGLFGEINVKSGDTERPITIKNLTVEISANGVTAFYDSMIDADDPPYYLPNSYSPSANPEAYAGGLIALYENTSDKEYNKAEIVSGDNLSGDHLIIENVTVKGGQISSNYNAGGLIGFCQTKTAKVEIKNCRVVSDVVVRYMHRIGNNAASDPRNYYRRAAAGGLIGFSNTPSSAYWSTKDNPVAKIIIDCCETTGKVDAFAIEAETTFTPSGSCRDESTASAGGLLGNYGLPVVKSSVQDQTHIRTDTYNARGELTITNSTVKGEIIARGAYKEGSSLGVNVNGETFNNMFAVRAGGIFGSIDVDTIDDIIGKVTISNCAATGEVTAQNYRRNNNHAVVYAGGFGGILYSNGDAKISKSYATGNVTIPDLISADGKAFANNHSNSAAGGFIGQASNYSGKSSKMSITIENCYASGNSYVNGYTKDNMEWVLLALGLPPIPGLYDLHTSGKPQAGGLIGYTRGSTITNCYAWGNAEGNYAGNLVGYYNTPCTSTNNYGVTGQLIKGDNDKYPTELNSKDQMKDPSNFKNWNFGSIWTYRSGINNGYPVLGAFYNVSSIQITPKTVNLPVDTTASETLYVNIYPSSLFEKGYTFSVDDTSLISIEVNGGNCIVRPNQEGKVGMTYVRVTHDDTGFSASCPVTVSNSVIRIYNEAELRQLKKDIDDNKYQMKYMSVLLEDDIELTAPWVPFKCFEGSFDGQGHVISNVYYDLNAYDKDPNHRWETYGNLGFFSRLGSATSETPSNYHIYVRNLGIEIATTTLTREEICEHLSTKISDWDGAYQTISSENLGMVVPPSPSENIVNVGGLIGLIGYADSITVESCFVSGGPITAYSYDDTGSTYPFFHVGGLVGLISNGSPLTTIRNCYTTVDVSFAGGDEIVKREPTVNKINSSVGGLLGDISSPYIQNFDKTRIDNCYTTGNIYGYGYDKSYLCMSKVATTWAPVTGGAVVNMSYCWALNDECQTIGWDYVYPYEEYPPFNFNPGSYQEDTEEGMQTQEYTSWDWENIWGRIPGINSTYPVLRIFHSFVDGVELDRDEITVPLYGTDAISPPEPVLEYNLTATVSPEGADNPAVTWSSNNEVVASVDQSGKVTLTGEAGMAVITVETVDGGFTDSCLVTVNEVEPIPGISLDKNELAMAVNDEETLIAGYDEIHYKVNWRSDRPGIATVDQDGTVTGVADGVAIITATLLDKNGDPVVDEDNKPYTAECEVTVRTGIFFLQSSIEIDKGSTWDLNDLVILSGISPGTIEWSSEDSSIVSVDDNGVVTGVKRGETTVTAILGIYTQVITVKVNQEIIDVSGYITFSPGSKTYSGAELDCDVAQIGGTGFIEGDTPTWTYTYDIGDNPTGNESLGATDRPVGVGNYKVTATYEDWDNKGSKTENFTVTPKELNVSVTVSNKPYDGTNGAVIASASLIGVVTGDIVTLDTPYPTASFENSEVGDGKTLSFTGNFTISGKDADKYTLTQPSGVTANITEGFTPVKDTHYTTAGLNAAGWSKTDFVITAKTGYQVSLTNTAAGDPWDDELPDYTAETDSGSVTFYVKSINTGEISVAKTEIYKIDQTAPEGDITNETNSIKSFLNTITFGLFFKNMVDVEVSGTDATSGVASIEYQKVASESEYDPEGEWTTGDRFSVTANETFVVYAKITDNAGNVTIINSDGVVVYTDSMQDTAAINFTKTSTTDVTASVILNGNTVNEIKNGTYTLVKNTDYTVATDGRVTFKASYLDTLAAGDYTLTISYNLMGLEYVENGNPDINDALNTTTIALSVVKAEVTSVVSVAPGTGDNSNPWIPLAVMAVSIGGIVLTVKSRKRRSVKGKQD